MLFHPSSEKIQICQLGQAFVSQSKNIDFDFSNQIFAPPIQEDILDINESLSLYGCFYYSELKKSFMLGLLVSNTQNKETIAEYLLVIKPTWNDKFRWQGKIIKENKEKLNAISEDLNLWSSEHASPQKGTFFYGNL